MAVTLNIQSNFASKSNEPGESYLTLTCSAGTVYATGGITVDLTAAIPRGSRFADFVQAQFFSSLGHAAIYIPGTTIANGKVKLFVGITEVANALSLTGLVLSGEVVFGRGVNGIPVAGLIVG